MNAKPEALSREEGLVLLRAAVAAPSVYNIQPWQFAIIDDRVELYLDTERQLPVADPLGRERIISCGAALEGLCLGMAHLGYEPQISLPARRWDPAHLATVRRGPARRATDEEARRYWALHRRHMYRHRFAGRPIPDDVIMRLQRVGYSYEVWVREIDQHRDKLVDLAEDAVFKLLADEEYRAELAAWTRRDDSRGDGVPLDVMGEEKYPVNGLSWALLVDDAMDQHALHQDRLLVLGTRIDTPVGWLRAGRALHAILLEATARGLAASMLTQVLEVAELRNHLTDALGLRGRPQALLRIGYPAAPVKQAPRRPLTEVLIELNS